MSFRTPLLVGLVLVGSMASLTWFVLTTSEDQFGDRSTYVLYGDFSDASGIRGKTRLQVNGIDVGKIVGMKHIRGKDGRLIARVELRVSNEYDVYENAVLRKVAESLLGDYRLDLDPGTPDTPKLPPESIISHVQSKSDLDQLQEQLKNVAGNVNEVTQSLSRVLAGPEGEGSLKEILRSVNSSMAAIEQTTKVVAGLVTRNDEIINKMIGDLGAMSANLADVTKPGGDIRAITQNLVRLSARLDKIASSVDDVLGPEAGEERGRLQQTMENINRSIEALNSIATKIDQGQGTVGRLVNDPGLIDKVEATVDDAERLIGGLSRSKTEVELRTQYEVPWHSNPQFDAAVKNILALRLRPRPDKYYLIEAISDPRGTSTRDIVTKTVNGGAPETTEINKISFNALKFSVQFAKRYYFLALRFGIIENTGGLGANAYAFNDRLEMQIDAFDFTRRNISSSRINPRLRGTALFEFVDHVYLQAGVDDPFNYSKSGGRLTTWFVGGALRFTDDDLKTLLTIAPTPK